MYYIKAQFNYNTKVFFLNLGLIFQYICNCPKAVGKKEKGQSKEWFENNWFYINQHTDLKHIRSSELTDICMHVSVCRPFALHCYVTFVNVFVKHHRTLE